MFCDFDNTGGIKTTPLTTRNFETISTHGGEFRYLTATKYDEAYTCTFDICKYICEDGTSDPDDIYMTIAEFRDIAKWLTYPVFRVATFSGDLTVKFNASFNVEQVMFRDKIIGARVTMVTDRPYGYEDITFTKTQSGTSTNQITWTQTVTMADMGDEWGNIYPLFEFNFFSANASVLHNITISVLGVGDDPEEDLVEMAVLNIPGNEIIELNCKTRTLKAVGTVNTQQQLYNGFNFVYPCIKNEGMNQSVTVNVSWPTADTKSRTVSFSYEKMFKINLN